MFYNSIRTIILIFSDFELIYYFRDWEKTKLNTESKPFFLDYGKQSKSNSSNNSDDKEESKIENQNSDELDDSPEEGKC